MRCFRAVTTRREGRHILHRRRRPAHGSKRIGINIGLYRKGLVVVPHGLGIVASAEINPSNAVQDVGHDIGIGIDQFGAGITICRTVRIRPSGQRCDLERSAVYGQAIQQSTEGGIVRPRLPIDDAHLVQYFRLVDTGGCCVSEVFLPRPLASSGKTAETERGHGQVTLARRYAMPCWFLWQALFQTCQGRRMVPDGLIMRRLFEEPIPLGVVRRWCDEILPVSGMGGLRRQRSMMWLG
mmetsp:Transcript_3042/g.8811  ORF Transcript_3042/g.8811 Transcript_3042/m.8811 type:complete len:239 (-) Transcript_3042:98-814(-)